MIIGLTGYKGVGKDTAAQWLVEDYGYRRLAFADKLKEAVAALFAIDRDDVDMYKNMPDIRCGIFNPTRTDNRDSNHFTMRQFLQRFGTEMGRNVFGDNFWVDMVMQQIDPEREADHVVITDVRFTNEAMAIHRMGGKIIWIDRANYHSDGHASEQKLPKDLIDIIAYNYTDLASFKVSFMASVEACEAGITNGSE